MNPSEPLIKVENLNVHFNTDEGTANALNGIDFSIERNQVLGVVGESGCGKSVMARVLMNLVMPPGKIASGSVLYRTKDQVTDIASLDPKGKAIRKIRGNEIAMIFQEPMTSLDPVFTIGNQMMEGIRLHWKLNKRQARAHAVKMLKAVGMPSAEHQMKQYPFNLSGGMRQRVMIAMALSCNPKLLIADEPTTALDVTIQAQVIELMLRLKSDFKTAILFITHDLGVISDIADEVIVMYMGKIVEKASVHSLFEKPSHPYTIGLMHSLPSYTAKKNRLVPIRGSISSPYEKIEGCGFKSRCDHVFSPCGSASPPLAEISPGHYRACWLDPDFNFGGK